MIFLFCSHDAPYYILSILPLALFSVRSRPRLYFNPGLFILHPFQVPSPRCLVENRAFAPLFAADPGLYITGLGQAAPAFHFEKSARFPFHRKQLLLNIFIRRLIILSLRSSTTVYLQRGRLAFIREKISVRALATSQRMHLPWISIFI